MVTARRMMDYLPALRRAILLARFAYVLLLVLAFASSALAIGQALGWHPIPELNLIHQAGLFYNTTTQGAFLALAMMILITYDFWWPWALALAPGLWLANSRGSFAAIAFGILATCFRRPLWLLVVALAFTVGWSYNPDASNAQRLAIWYAAATHLTFWGNGFGSFWNLWIGNPAWWPQYVHNDYLQTVFEFGVWSVIPFGIVAWATNQTSALDWPVFVTFLFIATFSMPLHMPAVAAIGALTFLATLTEMHNA
jgi:hypothetical protein